MMNKVWVLILVLTSARGMPVSRGATPADGTANDEMREAERSADRQREAGDVGHRRETEASRSADDAERPDGTSAAGAHAHRDKGPIESSARAPKRSPLPPTDGEGEGRRARKAGRRGLGQRADGRPTPSSQGRGKGEEQGSEVTPVKAGHDSPSLREKLESYVARYKLPHNSAAPIDDDQKAILKIMSSIASSRELTEEELAELICTILCGLGTCPPGCPGYYEPPWGPADNITMFDASGH